ncbi:HNH endonuclease [Micromonospora sp. R77]|uniref:HNH endonuclease n=1 Tax=Micromonospora sp. R77 TaxID=2925836 RepID=UPI001F6263C3|nr:HNH endonuclease [Micromonospora sp. R77]MCI4064520.1 HNH endonuclease [Micromonospora sp. R77]
MATKPKGIYKPAGWSYALSVRINIDSPYRDGEIFRRGDGTWCFAYHQENADPRRRDEEYTNKALMENIQHGMPVGVLKQYGDRKAKPPRYAVLGLAVPVAWHEGYFFFEGLSAEGLWRIGDTVSDVLVCTAAEGAPLLQNAEQPPNDDYDARLRAVRQIVARRGQAGFRSRLLKAYRGCCSVTGANAEAVLEAAHLRPYRGEDSNVLSNGLLLRSDVHTLLDLRLLAVEPVNRRVRLSRRLGGTIYSGLEGARLAEPVVPEQRPALEVLEDVWRQFQEVEDQPISKLLARPGRDPLKFDKPEPSPASSESADLVSYDLCWLVDGPSVSASDEWILSGKNR